MEMVHQMFLCVSHENLQTSNGVLASVQQRSKYKGCQMKK
jgi:hypothetical protein